MATALLRRRHLPIHHHQLCRQLSQSTDIPKKMQRVRDHGFDNYMEVHKKILKTLKLQDLLLSRPSAALPLIRLDSLARRMGFRRDESAHFLLKHAHVFSIFDHPVQRTLHCRLTPAALWQISEEHSALLAQLPDAVLRLRKLLMLSNSRRLRLEHLRIARLELGLPEDFELTVVLKNPIFFRLIESAGPDAPPRTKYVELINPDETLARCSIELLREKEYREKGMDAENIRFAFLVNFPPGFKIGKYYKIAVWKWQRLPYWSPYEDVSGYDMRSLEAQKRMEKRAVAMIHEVLSLTVEKKLTLEKIAHFRMAMDLPKKLKEFLLRHQGIFYISTRGNQGRLHTVFLREAYKRGELVEPNELYLARRRLAQLLLLSPRKAKADGSLTYFRPSREEEAAIAAARRSFAGCGELQCDEEGKDDDGSGADSDADYESVDEATIE